MSELRVAEQKLVGALSGEDDLDARAGESGQQELGGAVRVHHRRLAMPERGDERLREIARTGTNDLVRSLEMSGHVRRA